MAVRPSEGKKAIYRGKRYDPQAGPKYPPVEPGDEGIVMDRHPWDVESNPDHPLQFYPKKWGYIYCFPVSRSDVVMEENISLK